MDKLIQTDADREIQKLREQYAADLDAAIQRIMEDAHRLYVLRQLQADSEDLGLYD